VVRAATTAQASLNSVDALAMGPGSGTASALAAPTLNLPASYSALAANGQISWANALGAGSEARTLVLSIPGASLTASASSISHAERRTKLPRRFIRSSIRQAKRRISGWSRGNRVTVFQGSSASPGLAKWRVPGYILVIAGR
jgi:hypothetical protein